MEGFESSGRAAHQDVENRWQNQEYNWCSFVIDC
jgi:hypothetical protein